MVYPVVLTKEGNEYLVSIPDFDIDTEGKSLEDAIFMARDAIGLMGIELQDEGKELPLARDMKECEAEEGAIVTLVDVDLEEYRRKNDNRMVKKNCTIPFYLNKEAEKRGINFSKVLQEALREQLGY